MQGVHYGTRCIYIVYDPLLAHSVAASVIASPLPEMASSQARKGAH